MAFNDICGSIVKGCGKAVLDAGSVAVNKTIQVSQEAIEHTKETIELKRATTMIIEDAKKMFEESVQRLTIEQRIANKYIEELGWLKIDIAKNEMARFEELSEKLAIEKSWNTNTDRVATIEMDSIKNVLAPELAGALSKGLAIGAASGTAAYTSVALLGSASTGTAISALHGVAATKATLAFLGGGALSAGGAGVAGGMMVLGGVIAFPVMVASSFALDKGIRKQYEKACIYSNEVKESVKQTEDVINKTREITTITNQYIREILQVRGAVQQVLEFACEEYRDMNAAEIKGAYRFVELFVDLFDTPIIDSRTGVISPDAYQVLQLHREKFKQLIVNWTDAIQKQVQRKTELEREIANKEAELAEVIGRLEAQAEQIQGGIDSPYISIKRDLAEKYSYLEANSLQFLTTAEFLFAENQKVMHAEPDFSLCIVSCCKTIETELVNLLHVSKGWSLNDMIKYIEKYKMAPYRYFIKEIDSLRVARNGNAHTSVADYDKGDSVRTLLFGDGRTKGLLKMIEMAKQNKGTTD